MKKLIILSLLVSSMVYAADAENGTLHPQQSITRSSISSPILLEDIFSTNPKLETTLNYFSSNYPQSDFAQLNSEQQKALLVWAREIQLLEGLDEGSSLQKAQTTPTPTDLGVPYTFSYFQTNYPNSEIGQLRNSKSREVVLLAEVIHQKCGFTSSGSLNMAIRVPESNMLEAIQKANQGDQSEISKVVRELKKAETNDDRSELSKIWNDEVKPTLSDLNKERKEFLSDLNEKRKKWL